MEKADLFQLTAGLRRAFPRVVEVLAVCDEVERLAAVREVTTVRGGPKRDRSAYMREYRARKRAKD